MLTSPLQNRAWNPLPSMCQQPLGEMKIRIDPQVQRVYRDLPKGRANKTLCGTNPYAAQFF